MLSMRAKFWRRMANFCWDRARQRSLYVHKPRGISREDRRIIKAVCGNLASHFDKPPEPISLSDFPLFAGRAPYDFLKFIDKGKTFTRFFVQEEIVGDELQESEYVELFYGHNNYHKPVFRVTDEIRKFWHEEYVAFKRWHSKIDEKRQKNSA